MKKGNGTILLADDDCNNAELIRLAFRNAGFENSIYAVERGAEVIEYLKGEGDYANREKFPLPDLLVLDTKLHGMSGWEVLGWVRDQPQLKRLPVVILTGSSYPGDKENAAALVANAYEIKPQNFHDFTKTVKRIGELWLRDVHARSRTKDASHSGH